ncbi:hypothetical protein TrRE_jg9755 [Triparma retinervis]|uniref:HIN-200 domain-containing protein n=1 Tax=Triparma retinervis TaxID=2557542 RepID=A0A9W7CME9_9STRA|nr:hypothetical protein TrRE_jg9755 [Triparma retinervis]
MLRALASRATKVASPLARSPLNARPMSTLKDSYENIIVSTPAPGVALLTLNRPKALNALCDALLDDLIHAANHFDKSKECGAIVITGSEKAFAAGADIKEMSSRKLAMMCDIMIAGDSAKFGQPEINLGVIPGCGGTQRLVRAVGKSKAMEMCLTGNMIGAEQAERDGLVCRVVPADGLVDEAVKMGAKIASKSQVAAKMAKETVNAAYELNLAEGLRFERRMFHALFATEDQKEGMKAFIEKRDAKFVHK